MNEGVHPLVGNVVKVITPTGGKTGRDYYLVLDMQAYTVCFQALSDEDMRPEGSPFWAHWIGIAALERVTEPVKMKNGMMWVPPEIKNHLPFVVWSKDPLPVPNA